MIFSNILLSKLAQARHVVAFTGAGISAESGVPTFRGNEGIWTKFKPEELATVDAFMKNPDLVWQWYAHRKKIMGGINPNEGHRALVRMEEFFEDFTVITQNIDNLHRRAGSRKIFELHGNIERNFCIKCGEQYTNADVIDRQEVPRCTKDVGGSAGQKVCGGMIRPDVVWFGELLPEREWNAAAEAAASAEVFFSIGTSGVVYPAASLPLLAKHHGAFIVEINPEPTSLTEVSDEFLMEPAGSVLPLLCGQLTRSSTTGTADRL